PATPISAVTTVPARPAETRSPKLIKPSASIAAPTTQPAVAAPSRILKKHAVGDIQDANVIDGPAFCRRAGQTWTPVRESGGWSDSDVAVSTVAASQSSAGQRNVVAQNAFHQGQDAAIV